MANQNVNNAVKTVDLSHLSLEERSKRLQAKYTKPAATTAKVDGVISIKVGEVTFKHTPKGVVKSGQTRHGEAYEAASKGTITLGKTWFRAPQLLAVLRSLESSENRAALMAWIEANADTMAFEYEK